MLLRVLAIGNAERIECLWHIFMQSEVFFDMPIVVLEQNEPFSAFLSERCKPIFINELWQLDIGFYDMVFICSQNLDEIKRILIKKGYAPEKIHDESYANRFYPPELIMAGKKKALYERDQTRYISSQISVGAFTYGVPTARIYGPEEKITIGKFCSIADDVNIFGGGEHRMDWATTYPFNRIFPELCDIEGDSTSKGSVNIGNDVWLGTGCKIMSGVTIGDGAVVATDAVVTKDVPAYAIVGGIPAKMIRYRFSEEIRTRLLEIKWWDWGEREIYQAVPLLQSNNFEELFKYYEEIVMAK